MLVVVRLVGAKKVVSVALPLAQGALPPKSVIFAKGNRGTRQMSRGRTIIER